MANRKLLVADLVQAIKAFQDAVSLFDAVAADKLGVNSTDLRCLAMLRDEKVLQPSQLAAAVGLSRGAITTALSRLMRRGLVRCSEHEHDKRSYYVSLSKKAATTLEDLWGPMIERGRRHLTNYTVKELQLLISFMRRSESLMK